MDTAWWSCVPGAVEPVQAPVLQIAADGRWETAAAVPVDADDVRLVEQVAVVAAAAQDDIAVEVLWPGQVFVGARWGRGKAAQALAGARRASAALLGAEPRAVEVTLCALLAGTPGTAPEFAELGAVNAWASTGPLVLWRSGEQSAPAALDELLASRPDLTNCSHPVAVELATSVPQPCWVGVVVSERAGSTHRLDRALLAEVLARGTGTSA